MTILHDVFDRADRWRVDIESDIGGDGPNTGTRPVLAFWATGSNGAIVTASSPTRDIGITVGLSDDDLDRLTDRLIARREERG